MSEVYDVILGPLVTEKSALQQDENIYAFRVGERSSKIEIKSAIEDLFGVEVLGVRTARVRGKVKRFGQRTLQVHGSTEHELLQESTDPGD